MRKKDFPERGGAGSWKVHGPWKHPGAEATVMHTSRFSHEKSHSTFLFFLSKLNLILTGNSPSYFHCWLFFIISLLYVFLICRFRFLAFWEILSDSEFEYFSLLFIFVDPIICMLDLYVLPYFHLIIELAFPFPSVIYSHYYISQIKTVPGTFLICWMNNELDKQINHFSNYFQLYLLCLFLQLLHDLFHFASCYFIFLCSLLFFYYF